MIRQVDCLDNANNNSIYLVLSSIETRTLPSTKDDKMISMKYCTRLFFKETFERRVMPLHPSGELQIHLWSSSRRIALRCSHRIHLRIEYFVVGLSFVVHAFHLPPFLPRLPWNNCMSEQQRPRIWPSETCTLYWKPVKFCPPRNLPDRHLLSLVRQHHDSPGSNKPMMHHNITWDNQIQNNNTGTKLMSTKDQNSLQTLQIEPSKQASSLQTLVMIR